MDLLRIVIVDDQRMFRESLKTVIELRLPEAKVVGLASNGEEGLRIIHETNPNLIIMDINMPVMNGVECVKKLREEGNDVLVLMLTVFEDEQYLVESLKLGAVGYLLKDTEPEKFTEAIKMAYNGCTLLSHQVTEKLVDEIIQKKEKDNNRYTSDLFKLTQREFEILKHIGYGEDNQQISDILHLSEGTVRNYVSSIYEKLDLKDRPQAIRFAILSGLTNN